MPSAEHEVGDGTPHDLRQQMTDGNKLFLRASSCCTPMEIRFLFQLQVTPTACRPTSAGPIRKTSKVKVGLAGAKIIKTVWPKGIPATIQEPRAHFHG